LKIYVLTYSQSFDPTSITSKFNHIFAVVRPVMSQKVQSQSTISDDSSLAFLNQDCPQSKKIDETEGEDWESDIEVCNPDSKKSVIQYFIHFFLRFFSPPFSFILFFIHPFFLSFPINNIF
jgi:hypothetical protein